jgi:predicted dehydrogenase
MKKVKIGSVGLGRLGYEHASNLATKIPEAELTAICDIDAARVSPTATPIMRKCARIRNWTPSASSLLPSIIRSRSPWL